MNTANAKGTTNQAIHTELYRVVNDWCTANKVTIHKLAVQLLFANRSGQFEVGNRVTKRYYKRKRPTQPIYLYADRTVMKEFSNDPKWTEGDHGMKRWERVTRVLETFVERGFPYQEIVGPWHLSAPIAKPVTTSSTSAQQNIDSYRAEVLRQYLADKGNNLDVINYIVHKLPALR